MNPPPNPLPSADRLTARPDQRLVSVLGGLGFSAVEIEALIQTWTERRAGSEPLTDFLVRSGVLRSAAPDVLAMNWGDRLLTTAADDLLAPGGLDLVRRLVGAAPPASTPTAPPGGELTCGQFLGRCLITGRLAQGSYGTVYRALHRTLNIPVAVKVLHPDLLDSATGAANQFRGEALMLARLNHPNIVRVWDFDDTVTPPYLVLEFVEGATVAELIASRGSVRIDLAVRIVLQVVDGLEAAFRHGIVHRDIKPANLLLTRGEHVKIADLGLASVADRGRGLGYLPAAADALAGTVAYLAPEQAGRPAAADHRSDMYSLGATFYHMLTGRLPFTGRSPLEVLLKHDRQPVTPPHEVSPDIDRGLSELIVRMLAKDPASRFASYDDLRDALIDADIALSSGVLGAGGFGLTTA
jgi:hypothetical protein